MKHLFVLFDSECALCQRCRRWLMEQPAFIELRFVSLHEPDLAARFPGIQAMRPGEQLLVVSDEGAVYRGPYAWIMCLYSLRKYRVHAQRLAHPALLPWARRVCELLSAHRYAVSRWLFKETSHELARKSEAPWPPAVCARPGHGHCE